MLLGLVSEHPEVTTSSHSTITNLAHLYLDGLSSPPLSPCPLPSLAPLESVSTASRKILLKPKSNQVTLQLKTLQWLPPHSGLKAKTSV